MDHNLARYFRNASTPLFLFLTLLRFVFPIMVFGGGTGLGLPGSDRSVREEGAKSFFGGIRGWASCGSRFCSYCIAASHDAASGTCTCAILRMACVEGDTPSST